MKNRELYKQLLNSNNELNMKNRKNCKARSVEVAESMIEYADLRCCMRRILNRFPEEISEFEKKLQEKEDRLQKKRKKKMSKTRKPKTAYMVVDLAEHNINYTVGGVYDNENADDPAKCSFWVHSDPLRVLSFLEFTTLKPLNRKYYIVEILKYNNRRPEFSNPDVVRIKKEITWQELCNLGIDYKPTGSGRYFSDNGKDEVTLEVPSNNSLDGYVINSSGRKANINTKGNGGRIVSREGDLTINCCNNKDNIIASSGIWASVVLKSSYENCVVSTGDFAQIVAINNSFHLYSSGKGASIASLSDGGINIIESSGDFAKITTRDISIINSTGKNSIITCYAPKSMVRAKKGSIIILSRFIDKNYEKVSVKTEIVDGKRIKEDTWYFLDADGNFKEK